MFQIFENCKLENHYVFLPALLCCITPNYIRAFVDEMKCDSLQNGMEIVSKLQPPDILHFI